MGIISVPLEKNKEDSNGGGFLRADLELQNEMT